MNTASIYIHPSSAKRDLYSVCSQLKARGYDVVLGQRFQIAVPEQRKYVPRQQAHSLWWPRGA